MTGPETYDYIVVGAGSAGCVIANRLATGTDATVLLIEAGGPDTEPAIHQEQMSATMSLWGPGPLNWGYVTEPQAALAGREIPVARGKVWGGCSSVNAMLHVRGNRIDYDTWAALGNRGWSYEDVLPVFRQMENFSGWASSYRGAAGPLAVLVHADPSPVALQLFDAGPEVGIADRGHGFDYNGEHQTDTVFLYQATKTPEHRRASTAVAYLTPALDEPNLTVLSQAMVTRVLIESGRAVGVEVVVDGTARQVRCEREVVVSAGAYESPKLLMLSGIGPADTLVRHGIQVLVDLPGVGANLQDHMIVGVCYLSKREQPWEPTLIAETGFFTRSSAVGPQEAPDFQMKFGGLKFVSPEYYQDGPGFTFAPVLIQPRSVGYVSLKSADPHDIALLQPNYLSDPADLNTFVEAIERSRELANTRAMTGWVDREIAPGPDVTDRAGIEDYVRRNAGTLWHPVGTCAMGNGPQAVVDPQLRVRGVVGLRVADASVMPRIVSGNTNAASIMIGEQAARLLAPAAVAGAMGSEAR
ncbi:MAG TPA: GMC family oxidoreductase N-terminal domain-containing protein [Pseudonocardiaceae bacterium]|jgi:choline dehydrogenase|nr:GMC family oxidoreductase N-terminal domain-containing protein [Pseudonocardiaceae bacterium]